MKTLFVLSSLVTAMPAAKGEVAIMAADGSYVDVTSATSKLTGGVDDYLTFIMAVGNGSFRKFVVNPSITGTFVSAGSGCHHTSLVARDHQDGGI